MSMDELNALVGEIINLPVPYQPKAVVRKSPLAQSAVVAHDSGVAKEDPEMSLTKLEDTPRVKWIDTLANTPPAVVEIPEAKPPRLIREYLWWLRPVALVGFGVYACAIVNNVYSCWGLAGMAFATMVGLSVVGETALMVTLPRALRLDLVAMALAVLSFGVVAFNEFRVISMTTSDQAAQRSSLAVSSVAAACPPSSTTTTKSRKGTTTTTQSESEACKAAKAIPVPARPELAAFQAFTAWASRGSWTPQAVDYDNWRTLLLVLFLNSGGFFLGLARR